MWQRIQTLFLAIAIGLIISLFFCNMATIIGEGGAKETIRFSEKLPYLILNIMVLTANVCALFAFKARMLQMRVAILAGILLLGFQGWLVFDFINHKNEMVFSLCAVFPLIAAILDFLAARNIMLDEAMVLSSQRLRKARRR